MSKMERELETGEQYSEEEGIKIGKLMAQKDYGQDEVHVHRRKKNLRFRFKDIRRFELGLSSMLSNIATYKDGACVVFPGVSSDEKYKACDLVLQRKGNQWKAGLFLCGEKVGDVVQGDPVITSLDEFLQR